MCISFIEFGWGKLKIQPFFHLLWDIYTVEQLKETRSKFRLDLCFVVISIVFKFHTIWLRQNKGRETNFRIYGCNCQFLIILGTQDWSQDRVDRQILRIWVFGFQMLVLLYILNVIICKNCKVFEGLFQDSILHV